MEAMVTEIVDGDTFDVWPGWSWGGRKGNRIRPTGYDAAEMGSLRGLLAKSKLTSLLLNKKIFLGNASKVDRGRLVCDVYFEGKPLSSFF